MMGRTAMTRHERWLAAVRGQAVDRVPVAAWMHLATEHLVPAQAAQLHQAWWQACDWDLLKVMADYRLGIPDGLESFDGPDKLLALAAAVRADRCFEQQRQCVEHLMASAGPQVPVLDSGYDPYTFLLRHIGHDQAAGLWAHAEATLQVLQAITERTCAHLQQLKRMGLAGYFHATYGAIAPGQPRGISTAIFECFVRPFDLQILDAAEGLVRVLHAHGSGVLLERLQGYPFEVLHLADRTPGNPTLAQLRQWTPRCLMGGVDERTFTGLSVAGLRQQMHEAIAQVGPSGLILAPGCAVAPSSSGRLLRTLRGNTRVLHRGL